MSLTFRAFGIPGPQGSKRGFGGNRMVESSAKVKPWREAVKAAALLAMDVQTAESSEPYDALAGPVEVTIDFYFTRPKGHFGSGKNSDTLRADAPAYVAVKPDIDKITRATLDALTDCGVFRGDQQVAQLMTTKTYTLGAPGAFVTVHAL